ncbi:hypothetical protein ISS08_02495, partial [Candidatus Pacearchaeota archaeon]|nr:hypothetical protein [Candidatus Pacearchaeota archaeon]
IPRYEKPISYSGKLFDDENYGDSVKETTDIENVEVIEMIKRDLLKKFNK